MTIIRNIIVAFATYSRIPMPVIDIRKEDMQYSIAFLPLVGLVIGLVEYGIIYLSDIIGLPVVARAALWMFIPIAITGGFHIDGYMDTTDALRSYKPRQDKLEILKDPHIGAFAVISLAAYGLIYYAGTIVVLEPAKDYRVIICTAAGFYIARCYASIVSLTMKHAKDTGMLHAETVRTNRITLYISVAELVIGMALLCYMSITACVIQMVVLSVFSVWYRQKMNREFGGITGDTVGYYLVMAELFILIGMAFMITVMG